MDRNKKAKIVHSSEVFALGKSSSGNSDRKRDAGSTSAQQPTASKKAKILPSGSGSSSSAALEDWNEIVGTDCDSVDLVGAVLLATDQQDSDKIVSLVCQAIKNLAGPQTTPSKVKNDSILVLSLMYLAKIRPHIFSNDNISSLLLSLLKTSDQQPQQQHPLRPPSKNNTTVFVLAANLLTRGHYDIKKWPESFLRAYIDDAINDRLWVDCEECQFFTDHIVSAFGTKVPPQKTAEGAQKEVSNEDESSDSLMSETSRNTEELQLNSRFFHIQETLEKIVSDTIKEQFNRRQPSDNLTRNILKFASTTCGIPDVRALSITRLELWIHNAKLVKPAQELLECICHNISAVQEKDQETLAQLLKMRLKTKPLINMYMTCLKDLIFLQPNILYIMLKYVVQQELLILYNARNPNNMVILATIFQTKPEPAATHLAEIYQDFLLLRDDCLKTLRVFLRELVKTLRYDINLAVFCKALMTNRPEYIINLETNEFRERVCLAVADLVCLCRFLSVSPQIRDAHANTMLKSCHDQKNPLVEHFYGQMSQIQYDSLTWMFETVPSLFKLNASDYTTTMHKILMLEAPESYAKGDQWPPEPERMLLMNLVSEVPLLQDSVWRIIFIGVNKDINFSIPDTVEIIDQMVRRACLLKYTEYSPLEVNKLEIIDFFFSMAEYHHPENIALPNGYEPPKLAISALYWKIWIIMLILSAHNTSTIGTFCWNHYPMLKNLMEMCITNQFSMALKSPVDEELQLVSIEKNQIIEFETYLAAATSKIVITEHNSLLIPQVMLMNPMGSPRRPPKAVLEQLHNLNTTFRLGHLLCRKPDLLLDIIQRQGTSQSMPWLSDLVQSSDGNFNHLPVQCLCEFLLSNAISTDNNRDIELITFLQKMLHTESNDQTASEMLEYFLRRLSSPSRYSRQSAIRAFKLLLKFDNEEKDFEDSCGESDSDWLLKYLVSIPSFPFIRTMVIAQLRAACQVENSADLIMIYIQFIATNTLNDQVPEMLEHVACWSLLIVERSAVFTSILPTNVEDPKYQEKFQTLNCLFIMFNNFIIKMKDHTSPTITLPEFPDLLVLHFADGTQCHMHLNIIHALIILLAHSSELPGSSDLLDFFFPPGSDYPQAFTLDTNEKVQIIPDWLKLQMIRCSIERLVDVALQDLSADQIVLFIQNFGTPVDSMTKLLALLDQAIIDDIERASAAIINRSYLAQFIEIQQMRGAKNGHISMKALRTCDDENDLKMHEKSCTQMLKEIDVESTAVSATKYQRVISTGPVKVEANHLKHCHNIKNLRVYIQKMSKHVEPAGFNTILTEMAQYLESKIKESSVVNIQNQAMLDIIRNKQKILQKEWNPKQPVSENNHGKVHHSLTNLIHSTKTFDIENVAKKSLLQNINQKSLSQITESISVMLTMEKENLTVNKSGLLIDWVVEFDSELINTNQDVQMSLLFGRSMTVYRPYFLSLLIHQANWSTISKALAKLLHHGNSSIYDPSSVLDFIDAIIRNPKLWQGRDKSIGKHGQSEYALLLDENEIKAFIDYILQEEYLLDVSKINDRVTLLLQCVRIKDLDLKSIINHLDNHSNNSIKLVKDRFLQRLYTNIPHIFLAHNLTKTYDMDLQNSVGGCATGDKWAHNVITTITSLCNTKDFLLMNQSMELTLRKLAASHPSLLLRELPLIASLLSGRGHMDIHLLRVEHHLTLFNQILGMLELLQPKVFDDVYKDGLSKTLQCFFTLLYYHYKDIYGSTMYRLMEFVKCYSTVNPKSAFILVNQHCELFAELYMGNRNNLALQQLLGSPHFAKGLIVPPFTPKGDTIQQAMVSKLNNYSKMTHEEVVAAMIEIDSYKRPVVLFDAFEKLTELIGNSSSDIRKMAHSMLLKILFLNPARPAVNSNLFISYLQCLHSEDINISTSVLDNLPEIVLALQEYAPDILRCVFNLGITSKNNTYVPLKKCITTIKLQQGI